MKLQRLIKQIELVDTELRSEASKAVNRMLTIRNWLIGYYIVEFEQNGEDRAAYGDSLLQRIASKLASVKLKGMSAPELSRYRQFFNAYPYFGDYLKNQLPHENLIFGTLSQKFLSETPNFGTLSQKLEKNQVPHETLINRLAFSPFVE
jgi:hypothetical protein